jgi:hypothetical protein
MNTAISSGQDIPNIEESLAVVEKVYEAVRELQKELILGEKQSLTSANSSELVRNNLDVSCIKGR